jgi:hypothetical protein
MIKQNYTAVRGYDKTELYRSERLGKTELYHSERL